MSHPVAVDNRRILVIDDNRAIHEDFRKILCGDDRIGRALDKAEQALFGESRDDRAGVFAGSAFALESACQGSEGAEMVRQAVEAGRPYAVAFVDIRMPPGLDGVETIARLWEADPEIQTVICTAYSDYTWDDMVEKLGRSDRLLLLKKPFDGMEARQLAETLAAKWVFARQARAREENLERTIRERTQEVETQNRHLQEALAEVQTMHAQLAQVDKMASIGQLAAGVAHEINNPIGFITSNLNSLGHYVENLKQVLTQYGGLLTACLEGGAELRPTAEQVQALCDEVDVNYLLSDIGALISESAEGTQRVRQIVADLRDFSHVDNPDVNEEDINRLLDKTINVAWNELKYKTQVVREYGDLPLLPCYGGRLGQVFLNLLVNAAQAIESQGTITVRTGQAGAMVWIEVADTGCGIPAENLKRVFDPFFTTKAVGKGTGMGLHLAYRIIEAHHGRIRVQSTRGVGTTFRVELPLTGPDVAGEVRHDDLSVA